MFQVNGQSLFVTSIHTTTCLGQFARKADAIAFAREALTGHGMTYTSVVGRVGVVKEFFRYDLTDAERAELLARKAA